MDTHSTKSWRERTAFILFDDRPSFLCNQFAMVSKIILVALRKSWYKKCWALDTSKNNNVQKVLNFILFMSASVKFVICSSKSCLL